MINVFIRVPCLPLHCTTTGLGNDHWSLGAFSDATVLFYRIVVLRLLDKLLWL